ncbi:hypothetical protein [uncultured Tenacibaculum sp.]|uniref:hypothetical protein n=1 Tax=uncultured Tenacibaculum sp. TaxID=174713 RepID=UPI0026134EA7|nr:hypothetical protein [uncultured Tenacibaculum sp.]
MRYLEYTLVKNTNDIVIDAPCDKIQLIRNENHTKPTVIILIKKNIPVKTIKKITTITDREIHYRDNRYYLSKELSENEIKKNIILVRKITALGMDAFREKEFIKEIPESYEVNKENTQLNKKLKSNKSLNALIQESDFIIIDNQQQFENLLQEEKAVLYIQIDWSGYERAGRAKIFNALQEKQFNSLPKYLINNSNEEYQFFNEYLNKYNKEIGRVAIEGGGEIFLFKKGKIIDYINKGFLINQHVFIELFKQWIDSSEAKIVKKSFIERISFLLKRFR